MVAVMAAAAPVMAAPLPAAAAAAAAEAAAAAGDALSYNPTQGEGIVKTLSGAAYVGLLLYFLTRVLNRRARKAREEVRRLAATAQRVSRPP